MRFKEFQATRLERVDNEAFEFAFGESSPETREGVTAILSYADNSGFIVVLKGGNYSLILGNTEHVSNDLQELEHSLYKNHYLPEIFGFDPDVVNCYWGSLLYPDGVRITFRGEVFELPIAMFENEVDPHAALKAIGEGVADLLKTKATPRFAETITVNHF